MKTSRIVASVVGASLLAQGCGGTGFQLPPVNAQEALLAAQEIEADPSLPTFPRSAAYYRQAIERIQARLMERVGPICVAAETEHCRFHFHYVGDDEVNAFASDDGQIYMHRGLLDHLESDEEIAGVMGHEMGHHIANHIEEGKRSVLLGALLGGLLMTGAAAAGNSTQEDAEQMAGEGMMLGAQVGNLSFSKEQEREADLLAAYLLARAGYDLQRAGHVFEVFSKLNDKAWASWKDTHPAGPERIIAWRKAVAEVQASPDLLPRPVTP